MTFRDLSALDRPEEIRNQQVAGSGEAWKHLKIGEIRNARPEG
jgi:hypothetical protein